MAVVQGIREKVHLPIYDSLTVEAGKQLREAESSSILKFFVNVQKKTKLETNLQSASLLPHYNTFEARAMRVVISDLPPKFSADVIGKLEGLDVFLDLKEALSLTRRLGSVPWLLPMEHPRLHSPILFLRKGSDAATKYWKTLLPIEWAITIT